MCVLLSSWVFAQDSTKHLLSEARIETVHQGFEKDTLLDQWTTLQSLGNSLLLEGITPVRSTGALGQSVSAAAGGLTANQFAVTWNGFEINSPSLGTVDLGILNGQAFDASFHNHATSNVPMFSSAAGGWLELNTRSADRLTLRYGWNDIQNQQVGIFIPVTFGKWKGETRLFGVSARNAFTYTDDLRRVFNPENQTWENPTLEQEHNDHQLLGFVQRFSRKGKWNSDLNIWYQTSNTEIPEIMGSFANSFAEQADSALRITASTRGKIKGKPVEFSAAHFEESQRYWDRFEEGGSLSINSKIRTRSSSARALIHLPLETMLWIFSMNANRREVETNNYVGGSASDWVISPFAGFTIAKAKTKIQANARMDYSTRFASEPQGDVILEHLIWAKLNLKAQAVASRMYRQPTFNERYWQYEGGRDIAPERGDKYRIALLWSGWTTQKWLKDLRGELSYSWNRMDEMIQWLPSDLGFQPVNTGGTAFQTISTNLAWRLPTRIQTDLSWEGNFVKYEDLPYWLEEEQVNWNIRQAAMVQIGFKGLSVMYRVTHRANDYFVGAAFGQDDESVTIHHAGISKKFKTKSFNASCQITVQNLSDDANNLLTSYAMPGRVLELQINVEINPKR